MKPYCRILIRYKSSSIFSNFNNLSKSQTKPFNSRCESQIVGFIRVIELNRRAFSASGSDSGFSRVVFSHVDKSSNGSGGGGGGGGGSGRGILVIPHVASDLRNLSTSVDSGNVVNEKGFERIYIQGGLNVKPLVLESVEAGRGLVNEEESRVGIDGSGVNIDDSRGLEEGKAVEKEVSKIEEEAWRLLRNAVVSYCGNPVGTVAANDPVDKQPLNYDQVFIRDFVPSALAFLLKGEGEIVKNFLLHTLQLQVLFDDLNCFIYLLMCTL